MPLPWLRDLAASLVVPIAGLAFSMAAGRAFDVDEEPSSPELRVSLGIGAALAFAQAVGMALGAVGLLRGPVVIGCLVAGLLAVLAVGRARLSGAGRDASRVGPYLLLALPLLLMASFPPWDRDEMVYHLALPRAFAEAGGFTRPDDNIFASFPLGWESIEAVLHALGKGPDHDAPFNPRLLGAWTSVGVVLATTALARELGAKRLSPLAGVALGLVPTFVEFGSSAYVEPYLMLASTLGLVGLARVSSGKHSWWALSALAAGVAVSTKYSGLAVAALLALGIALSPGDAVERRRRTIYFVALTALVGCPFYIRNLVQRGNPFFPMAYGLFEGEGWDPVRAAAYWETLRQYGAGDSALDALTAPLRVFFARDFLHGFEGSIGPLPLLGAIGAAAISMRKQQAPDSPAAPRLLLLFCSLYLLFWASSVVQSRFLLVALPPAFALGAMALSQASTKPGAASGLVVAAQLAWGASGYGYLWSRQPTTAWLRGELTTDQALSRALPESYSAERRLESDVPPGARVWLVWMRGYTYYLRRPYKLDCVYEEWRLAELLDAPDEKTVEERLRQDGSAFLLVNDRFLLRNGSADTRPGRTRELRARFEQLVAKGLLRPVWTQGEVTLFAVAAH